MPVNYCSTAKMKHTVATFLRREPQSGSLLKPESSLTTILSAGFSQESLI